MPLNAINESISDFSVSSFSRNTYKVDLLVVELAALLHDIADWKLNDGDSSVGPRMAREWLDSMGVEQSISDHVCQIIAGIFAFQGHPANA